MGGLYSAPIYDEKNYSYCEFPEEVNVYRKVNLNEDIKEKEINEFFKNKNIGNVEILDFLEKTYDFEQKLLCTKTTLEQKINEIKKNISLVKTYKSNYFTGFVLEKYGEIISYEELFELLGELAIESFITVVKKEDVKKVLNEVKSLKEKYDNTKISKIYESNNVYHILIILNNHKNFVVSTVQ